MKNICYNNDLYGGERGNLYTQQSPNNESSRHQKKRIFDSEQQNLMNINSQAQQQQKIQIHKNEQSKFQKRTDKDQQQQLQSPSNLQSKKKTEKFLDFQHYQNYVKQFYIRCPQHYDQYITNFAQNSKGLLPVCPACIPIQQMECIKSGQYPNFVTLQDVQSQAWNILEQQRADFASVKEKLKQIYIDYQFVEPKMLNVIDDARQKAQQELDNYFNAFINDTKMKIVSQNHYLSNELQAAKTQYRDKKKQIVRLQKNFLQHEKHMQAIIDTFMYQANKAAENKIFLDNMSGNFDLLVKQLMQITVSEQQLVNINKSLQEYILIHNQNLFKPMQSSIVQPNSIIQGPSQILGMPQQSQQFPQNVIPQASLNFNPKTQSYVAGPNQQIVIPSQQQQQPQIITTQLPIQKQLIETAPLSQSVLVQQQNPYTKSITMQDRIQMQNQPPHLIATTNLLHVPVNQTYSMPIGGSIFVKQQ